MKQFGGRLLKIGPKEYALKETLDPTTWDCKSRDGKDFCTPGDAHRAIIVDAINSNVRTTTSSDTKHEYTVAVIRALYALRAKDTLLE